MNYIDHFGNKSENYLNYRPNYPDELYQYLSSLVVEHDLAWDCGTGNGQAAVKLANYFKQVIGTDLNQAQLDVAIKKDNIHYYCWPAEKTEIPTASVDIITVAQALHWFNFDSFYEEVRRVAKPKGIIAAWCYALGSINDEIDIEIKNLYTNILGSDYWPKERRWIDNQYQTIPFPFSTISSPHFKIEKELDFQGLIGYLNTWSAVKEYQKQNLKNPIDFIHDDLLKAWGQQSILRKMFWPIHLLVGHVFNKK